MKQEARNPRELFDLVARLAYKPGWRFNLADIDRGQDCNGLTLIVTAVVPDSYDPETTIGVNHYFIVPAASYDRRSWMRWLLDQVLLVEQHEACEFFRLRFVRPLSGGTVDKRPYAPNHGPGRNPYTIHELGTVEDAETSFRGERNEGSQA
jgi:hypothetical protein